MKSSLKVPCCRPCCHKGGGGEVPPESATPLSAVPTADSCRTFPANPLQAMGNSSARKAQRKEWNKTMLVQSIAAQQSRKVAWTRERRGDPFGQCAKLGKS